MSEHPPAVVATLTAAGQAGIAVVGVKGPEACMIVGQCFAPLARHRPEALDRPLFGTFTDGDDAIDEVMVAVHRVGSWHAVEVCCHGGTGPVDGIVAACERRGAHVVAWQDYAAAHAPDDPRSAIARQAMLALPWALTERVAGVLLDQMAGAIDRAIETIADASRHGDRATALAGVDRLLATAPLGLHLTQPWRVTITGRANVGKSTLLNALVGYQRVTVSHMPGTTRDVVRQLAAADGWPIELADTAGIRPVEDWVEQAGIDRTHRWLARTELALVVLDGSEPLTDDDQRVLDLRLPCPTIHVVNKVDLPRAWPTDRVPGAAAVSALRGDGLDRLVERIAGELVPQPPEPDTPIVFHATQVDALRLARDALMRGATADAAQILSALP